MMLLPCENNNSIKKLLDSEGRLVDGHENDAALLRNVLHFLNHTVGAGWVEARGWLIEEQQRRLVYDVNANRHPPPLSPRDTAPAFVADVRVSRSLFVEISTSDSEL